MEDFTSDLENWMSNLPDEIRLLPIINLAIPGSHDSMSYGICRSRAKIAPDADPVVSRLYKVIPCVIRRWATTQKLTSLKQLENGIRYFDLRTSLNKKDNKFYFVHGLYCDEISEPLAQIKQFLDTHPREFVILDFQHFYDFSDSHYVALTKCIIDLFQTKIFESNDGELKDLSLKSAESKQKQVLVIYRYSKCPQEFWQSDNWPTSWPNQIKILKLEKHLEQSLEYRSPIAGFVSQCVVTPPVNFIITRFFMSLRRACAKRVQKGLFDWIKQQTPGQFSYGETPTCNVFIADFIELKDSEFCKVVVCLNEKLLQ